MCWWLQHDLGGLDDRMQQAARAGDALHWMNPALTEEQRRHRTTKSHEAAAETPYLNRQVQARTAHWLAAIRPGWAEAMGCCLFIRFGKIFVLRRR
jgi:hypothetical protein